MARRMCSSGVRCIEDSNGAADVYMAESAPPRGACIPIRADVDCGEITARNFRVVDTDVYSLDGDGDGIACET